MDVTEEITLMEEMISFLQHYSWLYNFPVIKIFSFHLIDKLPKEWSNWFQKNKYNISVLFPYQRKIIDCRSLENFIADCHKFSIPSLLKTNCKDLSFEAVTSSYVISPSSSSSQNLSKNFDAEKIANQPILNANEIWKNITQTNPKKKYEVELLSSFVNKIKQYTKSDKVLDIGSGMGYLDLYLHLVYGYKIIGAEGSLSNVNASTKLRDKCLGASCPSVEFIYWNLENNISTFGKSKKVITDYISSNRSCACKVRGKRLYCKYLEQHTEILSTNMPGESGSSCTKIERGRSPCAMTDEFKSTFIHMVEKPEKNIETPSVDLVSLHSCGDLSPIMLKMFANNNRLSSVVALTCCYHKMSSAYKEAISDSVPSVSKEVISDSEIGIKGHSVFRNFPMSRIVSKVMKLKKFELNTFGLRLASEESISHWQKRAKENLEDDVTNIAYRSILEDVCDKNNLIMKKLKRRCGKKSSYKTFKEYITVILKECKFLTMTGEDFTDLDLLTYQLENRYLDLKDKIPYVGLVRVLQLTLQPVLESLMLLDGVFYLKEKGFSNSGVVEVFDEFKSPRNKAIFAFRDEYLKSK